MTNLTQGVLVDLPDSQLRDQIVATLAQMSHSAVSRGRPGGLPAVVISTADAPRASGMTCLRVWRGGRQASGENPFHDPSVRHVLGAVPSVDRGHLETTLRHLATRLPIPLGDLVTHPHLHRARTVSTWQDYTGLGQTVAEAFAHAGVKSEVCRELGHQCEELATNGIYDAPVAEGRHLFAAISRREPVPIPRSLDVEMLADSRHAVIVVRDHFGSLSAAKIVANLNRCYGQGAEQIDQKPGGAGLGLFMVLAGSSRLVFNISPDQCTEVVLVRRHDERRAAFQASAPTLNICCPEERRGTERYAARLAALAIVAGETVCGLVVDGSARGASVQALRPAGVTVRQKVSLTVFDETIYVEGEARSLAKVWQLHPIVTDVAGTVRWVDAARRGGCQGFGVEFDEASDALAKFFRTPR